MKEEFILKLVQIQLQVKFLHWQTLGDAKHRAYGDLYEKWVETIDEFAEQMMGKYGRIELDPEFSIMFQDIKHLNLQNFIDGIVEFLVSMTDQLDPKYDTDLLNLRDEMLGDISKLKYLLPLKY